MIDSDPMTKSLLQVARDLKRLNEIREFRKEFENEKSNFPPIKNKQSDTETMQIDESESQSNINKEVDLNMEVYEDKDYDIEEIKFWNFMSKTKTIKPSIVRTVVYKVPESQYIVKKCTVMIESKDEQRENNKENTLNDEKPNEVSVKNEPRTSNGVNGVSEPSSIQVHKNLDNSNLGKSLSPNKNLTLSSNKYNEEDIILIGENDDIIEFDKGSKNSLISSNSSNSNNQNEFGIKENEKLAKFSSSNKETLNCEQQSDLDMAETLSTTSTASFKSNSSNPLSNNQMSK